MGCCRQDEHNPYIREHAIMCLRFAVEGNPENAIRIRQMAEMYNGQLTRIKNGGMSVTELTAVEVPREVLDTQGYETFMDGKGQVGLRRKDFPQPTSLSIAAAAPLAPATSLPPAARVPANAAAALQAAAAQAIQGAIAGTSALKGANPKMTKLAVERAAELMQNALRELPLPESFGKDDKGIIERLNKVALEHADLIAASASLAGHQQLQQQQQQQHTTKKGSRKK